MINLLISKKISVVNTRYLCWWQQRTKVTTGELTAHGKLTRKNISSYEKTPLSFSGPESLAIDGLYSLLGNYSRRRDVYA